jgi:hypothetical protein
VSDGFAVEVDIDAKTVTVIGVATDGIVAAITGAGVDAAERLLRPIECHAKVCVA